MELQLKIYLNYNISANIHVINYLNVNFSKHYAEFSQFFFAILPIFEEEIIVLRKLIRFEGLS